MPLAQLCPDGLRLWHQALRHLLRKLPAASRSRWVSPERTRPPTYAPVGEDLHRGLTHYPPNNGFAWLREAICAWRPSGACVLRRNT